MAKKKKVIHVVYKVIGMKDVVKLAKLGLQAEATLKRIKKMLNG